MNQPIDPHASRTVRRSAGRAFRSHAQSLEDASLFKALRDVRAGFYLDIGSYEPLQDSVSAGFYERGWRGISVDPLPGLEAQYAHYRSDETFLSLAVSHLKAKATLFRVEGTGRSSLEGDGQDAVSVQTKPLSEIFDQCEEIVHWLKIDVEGHETAVIDSWGDHMCRPWIICIEHETDVVPAWHDALLGRDYAFIRWDGLNRFYLHSSQMQRCAALSAPPSVLDDILITQWSGLSEIPGRLIGLEAERDSMKTLMERQDAALDDYRLALKAANRAQDELHSAIHDHKAAIVAGDEAQAHMHRHIARIERELTEARQHNAERDLDTERIQGLEARILRLQRQARMADRSHLAAANALKRGVADTENKVRHLQDQHRELQDERATYHSRIADLDSQIAALRDREAHLMEEVERHRNSLDAVKASTAWRITAPLRGFQNGIRSGRQRFRHFSGRARSSGGRRLGSAKTGLKSWVLDLAVMHWRRDYKWLRPVRLFVLARPALGRKLSMRPDHWDESWLEEDPFDPDPSATQAKLAADRAADPNPARYKGPPPSEHPDQVSPGRAPRPGLFAPARDVGRIKSGLSRSMTSAKFGSEG